MHSGTTPTHQQPPADPGKTLLTVEAAARHLSIGRTLMYGLIKSGAVETVRVGRLRRVPAEALTEFMRRLATEQGTR